MDPATVVFLKAVLDASWQGSLVILLILAVRPLLGLRVPARWRYLLWIFVLIRLLVPAFMLPRSPTSLQNIPAVQRPIERAQVSLDNAYADYVTSNEMRWHDPRGIEFAGHGESSLPPLPAAPPRRMSWWEIGAMTWLCGAALFAAWIIGATIRLHRRLRHEDGVVDEAIVNVWKSCCARFSMKHPPRLLATRQVDSPALIGALRPALLIPKQAREIFSAQDWEHIFMHELAHFRRCDHWSQMIQLLALCAHWFNPLVWFGFRFLRADRELATDELALKRLATGRATAYGGTLLKVLSGRASVALQPGLVGIIEDAAQLKQRLRRIVAFGPRKALGSVIGLGLTLALAALVLGRQMNKPDMSVYAGMKPPDIIVAAATKGDLPAIRKMIDAGAPLNPEKDKPSPALIAALQNGWLDCADYLVKKGANSDPLAMAAAKGDPAQIDKALAKEGQDFEKVKTACEVAAVNGQTAIFAKLYHAIRLLNGHLGWAPDTSVVINTIARGHREVVEEMLNNDGLLLNGEVIRYGQAASRTAGMREWLVSKGLRIPAYDDNERLIDASAREDIAEMERLINAGAKINYTGEAGWTPITIAASAGQLKAVKLLLAHGANPNSVKDCYDLSALCLAKTPGVADALLAAGADINAKMLRGNFDIIDYCVTFGPKEMVQWFVNHGIDPAKAKCEEPTLLFDAHDPDIAEILIQHGVNVNAREEREQSPLPVGETALHRIGYSVDGREWPAAMAATGGKPAEVARILLKHGADPNARDKNGVTPLMCAPDGATVDVLVEFGADLKATTADGRGVLEMTGDIGDVSRLQALMRHGVPFDLKTDGPSMLLHAASHARLDFMAYLLKLGVDPNAVGDWSKRDSFRLTPLFAAVEARQEEHYETEHYDAAKLLLEHGAKVTGPLKEPSNKDLWTFVIMGRKPEFARLFWEHGFRGVSELTYAINQGEPIDEIRKLLDRGMPADPPQDVSITPLAQAAYVGNMEEVKLLVERKANMNGMGSSNSPLSFAETHGRDEIVDYLLKQGVHVGYWNVFETIRDSSLGPDNNPYILGKEHFEKTLKLLIDAGALAGLTGQQTVSLFRIAIFNGNPLVVKMLLDAGLDIDSHDKDGKSVLQNVSGIWKSEPNRKPSPEMLAVLKPVDKDGVLK